jgi:hypothetical protein
LLAKEPTIYLENQLIVIILIALMHSKSNPNDQTELLNTIVDHITINQHDKITIITTSNMHSKHFELIFLESYKSFSLTTKSNLSATNKIYIAFETHK